MDRNKSISNLIGFIRDPDILILINRLDPQQHRVVNYKTGEVIDVVKPTLVKFARGAGDEVQNLLRDKDWPALFGFNPYDPRVIWQAEDGTTHYNQYQTPLHARAERDVKKLPAVFDDFLTFLFDGNPTAKNHMLDVLSAMLKRRVETIPCLVGAGGIGKNTLVEHFLPLLIGKSNQAMARQCDIKSNFTLWSENKQVIVYDEVKLNDDFTVNAIKSRTNETVVLEGKNLERREARNFATSFILSNDEKALGAFLDDRRASIYPLTQTPLKDAEDLLEAHGGSIDSLRLRLLDPETVADVYWHLRAREVGSLSAYKDQGAYEHLKAASSSDEVEYLINSVEAHLKTSSPITLADVQDRGWIGSTSYRKLSELLRAAANHEGRLFVVGSGHSKSTEVRLRKL